MSEDFVDWFKVYDPGRGTVRLQLWPEGLCLWVGKRIVWREWDWRTEPQNGRYVSFDERGGHPTLKSESRTTDEL